MQIKKSVIRYIVHFAEIIIKTLIAVCDKILKRKHVL